MKPGKAAAGVIASVVAAAGISNPGLFQGAEEAGGTVGGGGGDELISRLHFPEFERPY